jgi:hypothetical protein
VEDGSKEIFAYTRTYEKDTVVVIANFSTQDISWPLPAGTKLATEKVLASNYGDVNVEGEKVALRPFEAFACFIK